MEFSTVYPDDVFLGEENHPQCCFFELFASSSGPDCDFYGEMFCHMTNRGNEARICKGDYLKCPLAGKLEMYESIMALFKDSQ